MTIYPGDAIKDEWLVDRAYPADTPGRGGFVSSRETIVGKIARRTLLPGAPIPSTPSRRQNRGQWREGPDRARGGRVVHCDLRRGAAGRRAGDVISLRNLETGLTVSGTVQADGSVRLAADDAARAPRSRIIGAFACCLAASARPRSASRTSPRCRACATISSSATGWSSAFRVGRHAAQFDLHRAGPAVDAGSHGHQRARARPAHAQRRRRAGHRQSAAFYPAGSAHRRHRFFAWRCNVTLWRHADSDLANRRSTARPMRSRKGSSPSLVSRSKGRPKPSRKMWRRPAISLMGP